MFRYEIMLTMTCSFPNPVALKSQSCLVSPKLISNVSPNYKLLVDNYAVRDDVKHFL